jgi:hypothetical protein
MHQKPMEIESKKKREGRRKRNARNKKHVWRPNQ